MINSSPIRYTFPGGLAVARQNEGLKGKPVLLVGDSGLHEEPSEPQPAARHVEGSFTALMVKFREVSAYANAPSEPKAEERKLEESVVIHKRVALAKQEPPRSQSGFWAWLCSCCKKKPSSGGSI